MYNQINGACQQACPIIFFDRFSVVIGLPLRLSKNVWVSFVINALSKRKKWYDVWCASYWSPCLCMVCRCLRTSSCTITPHKDTTIVAIHTSYKKYASHKKYLTSFVKNEAPLVPPKQPPPTPPGGREWKPIIPPWGDRGGLLYFLWPKATFFTVRYFVISLCVALRNEERCGGCGWALWTCSYKHRRNQHIKAAKGRHT